MKHLLIDKYQKEFLPRDIQKPTRIRRRKIKQTFWYTFGILFIRPFRKRMIKLQWGKPVNGEWVHPNWYNKFTKWLNKGWLHPSKRWYQIDKGTLVLYDRFRVWLSNKTTSFFNCPICTCQNYGSMDSDEWEEEINGQLDYCGEYDGIYFCTCPRCYSIHIEKY